jgi:polyphosphate glucokinase
MILACRSASRDMKPTAKKESRKPVAHRSLRTLSVDVGGTHIKAIVLNELGAPTTERTRAKTPQPSVPDAVLDTIAELAAGQGKYDRISVGFPGIVRNGVVERAGKLGRSWDGHDLGTAIAKRLGRPVRIVNDADMQGYGVMSGAGVEVVVTLGTGVGTSVFVAGLLLPNVEMGDDRLCNAELRQVVKRRWRRRLAKQIERLDALLHFDRLYLGGGNAKHADISQLPPNVTIVSNVNGLIGGIALWKDASRYSALPPNVSQESGSPESRPRRSQRTRISEDP